jgi:predicted ester cyclase
MDGRAELVRRLVEDVMPNGRFAELDEIVAPGCTTRRAGFADLVAARGQAIPSDGTFRERFEAGWTPMSQVLAEQCATVEEIGEAGDTVWARWRGRLTHRGEFLGAPGSARVIEYTEVGILHFGDDGRIDDVWFLCEELNVARQLGFELTLIDRENS